MPVLREGRLGGSGLQFPPTGVLEETVRLGFTPVRARALLRGFEVGFAAGDRRLRELSITLETLFGDGAGEVRVRARPTLLGDDWSPTTFVVHYTLVAE